MKNKFIRAVEDKFYFEGKEVRLRGLGIGTWFNLEHFMFGFPTPDSMIRQGFSDCLGREQGDRFFKEYENNFMAEEDFAFLKQCGVNFIRVPFRYSLFLDDQNPEVLREEGFACFDRLFRLAGKYQIFVMPDLHTVPGSQNPDWHSDNSMGKPLFWKYEVFRKQMVSLWGNLAERYAEETWLMGYDLLNEPAMADWEALNSFYEETIRSIRQKDKNHLIVLEGDQFSMDFSQLKHFEDPQLALGFHYYPTVWHPELLTEQYSREERKQAIGDGFDRLYAIREQFHRPVLCGEFGYGRDCGDAKLTTELLTDTLSIMEERGASWCLWCYKDAHFMSLVSPKEEGSWMQTVDRVQKRWDQDKEKEQAQEILDLIAEKWYPEMNRQDRYLLQFRLRAVLYDLQQEYVTKAILKSQDQELLMESVNEFCFSCCEINQDMMEVLTEYLG